MERKPELKSVIEERILNAVHKSLQWDSGEITGINMHELEQKVKGILQLFKFSEPSLPTEPKQEDGNFKKFSLLKETPTVASANTSYPVNLSGEQQTAEIEKIIVDWLKSENENATYCAHLISEHIKLKSSQARREILNTLPTRKAQIIAEVLDLREQVKVARREVIQEAIDKFNSLFEEGHRDLQTFKEELEKLKQK
jgi:hypothetical protein